MKETLLIVGAGEYGQLVKELAETLGYKKIDFLDDNSELAIGKVEEYQQFAPDYENFIVAIGNPNVRRQIIEKLQHSFALCTLIHPTAVVSKTAIIGEGCVIEANAVVNTAAYIGKACLVNAGSVVNHNSRICDYCQIDCNAVVASDAVVPENTKVSSCIVWNEK